MQEVNVLALVSNQLPSPKDDQGGSYSGGTIMDSSNIVVVATAQAISAALSKRDKKIKQLETNLSELRARLSRSSTPLTERRKPRTRKRKRP